MSGKFDIAHRPRVIVCGTRTFSDWRLLYDKLDKVIENLTNPLICTGAVRGMDKLVEEWAMRRKFSLFRFHTDPKHKEDAEVIRNKEMLKFALERKPAFLVSFWDGKSTDTRNLIEQARKAKIKMRIYYYD